MRNWLRFVLCGAAVLSTYLVATSAQITVPFPSFTAGTTIQPDEVNSNFARFGDALNRTGGTMTGTLTTRDLIPDGNGTRDLAATGTRYRDGWFSRNVAMGGTLGVTGAATLSSTLTVSSSGASAIDVAGGINAGSGNVGIVGTDGRIPALSSTYVASLSGAALTALDETNITDGSILARVGGTETISGAWTWTNTLTSRALTPSAGSTYDIGASGTRYNNIWAVGLSLSDTSTAAISVAGGITAGSGSVGIVGTNGKIPALSSTYFNSSTTATPWTFSGGVAVGSGTTVASVLTGTATWNPASLTTGSSTSALVTVTGVQANSPCFAGFRAMESGLVIPRVFLSANATENANEVRVQILNESGGTVDMDSNTVRVTCLTY